jgi:hypothetical protein
MIAISLNIYICTIITMLPQHNMFWLLRPSSGILYCTHIHTQSNSSVDIVTRPQIGQSWLNITDFLFSKASRLVLGPTPPLIQELLGTLTQRVEQFSVKLTTHLHVKLYFHSPSMPSRFAQGHLYLYFAYTISVYILGFLPETLYVILHHCLET